eukprot:13664170-Alexandrium_andersonii.AAC.1
MFADSGPLRGLFGPSFELGPLPPKEGSGRNDELRPKSPATLRVFRPMTRAGLDLAHTHNHTRLD